MSLATSAASWTLDDIPPLPITNKKRQSTVRTASEIIGKSSNHVYMHDDDGSTNARPTREGWSLTKSRMPGRAVKHQTIQENLEEQQDRKVKVNKLLDKLTGNGANAEGLMDYVPAGPTATSIRSDDSQLLMPKIQSLPTMQPTIERNIGKYIPVGNGYVGGSTLGEAYSSLSEHKVSGWSPTMTANLRGKTSDDKLMEKINYMIHLLEEQKMEKTNYVMEEFVLYTMLGVFVIYVVDSFSRSAKYIR